MKRKKTDPSLPRADEDSPWKEMIGQYRRHAVSLAILADDDPGWRPDRYRWEQSGCEAYLRFPTAKLLDYSNRLQELDQSDNPFALLVKAHLDAHATRHDAKSRLIGKVELAGVLYRKGFERQLDKETN